MAFTSQTFSALEQPTLAKWNILNSNDDDLNARIGTINGFTNVWWEELGRTTLGSAGDTITVSSLPARKYLTVLWHCVSAVNNIQPVLRFNNDTGSNYSLTYSQNFGAVATLTSQTEISVASASSQGVHVGEATVSNFSSQRKMVRGRGASDASLGAANGSTTIEVIGKWANTSAQISRVDLVNLGAGDFASGSQLVVLGHD